MKGIKSIGVTLLVASVALLGLTACSQTPSTEDASSVACTQIGPTLTKAQTSLDKAKATLAKTDKTTPARASAQADVTTANTKVKALLARQKKCDVSTPPPSPNQNGKVGSRDSGSADVDGTKLPIYNGTPGTTVVGDTTTDPNTPPLFNFSSRYSATSTKNWKGLVDRINGEPAGLRDAYIKEVNALAPNTGFTWSQAEQWAQDVPSSLEVRIIQVFNSNISDADAQKQVATWLGNDAYNMNVVHFGDVVNTRLVGANKIGTYLDAESMIRVSLAPLVGVNGQWQFDGRYLGNGIFVDCGNIHYVPKQVYVCKDTACKPPVTPPATCPAGQKGTPATGCWVPCSANPNIPAGVASGCSKDWSLSVKAPAHVVSRPNDAYESPQSVAKPTDPATTTPKTTTTATKTGATPDPTPRQTSAPATGTGGESANPPAGSSGSNDSNPGNPFGGADDGS